MLWFRGEGLLFEQLLSSCLMGAFVDVVTCHSYKPLSYPPLPLTLTCICLALSLSLSRLLYGLSHVLSVPKKCVNSSLIIFIQFFATVTAAALAPSHFHSLCLFVTLPVYCMFVCLLRLPSLLASTLASICFEITTIPGTQYLCTTVELPLRCPGLSVSFMTAVNCARDWIA